MLMRNVLALILAGGRVDDLDVLTFFRPKSIMPFGGIYRIIDFPMSNLAHSGIEKVGIFSQYRPLHLIEHISGGTPWDMTGRDRFVTILPPFKGRDSFDWYQGTADAVYQNLDFIKRNNPELILILSGDHIYRMDYRDIISFHLENKADLTIGFAKVPKEGASRFGLARIDEKSRKGGKVLEYIEKPQVPAFDWASLTIYVFRPQTLIEALEVNSGKSSHEFGKDIIPGMVGQCAVYGYTHHAYWGYTRSLAEYWQANMDLLGSTPKLDINTWEVMTNIFRNSIRDRQPALVGPAARVENSLFYAGCTIEGKVKNSVLFPGVRVARGARVEDSILFFDTTIEEGAKVMKTIADMGVTVGRGVEAGASGSKDLTIIGMRTTIPGSTKISPGVTVYPNLEQEKFAKNTYRHGEVVK